MSKPTNYKKQPACENCYYSDFTFYNDDDSEAKQWSCDKFGCDTDSNGYCDNYKETK